MTSKIKLTAPEISIDANASPITYLVPGCSTELRIDLSQQGCAFLYSRAESDKWQPIDSWRGHLKIYRLYGNVDPQCFGVYYNAMVRPLVQIALDGYSSKWDGAAAVAQYTDDARSALDEIELLFNTSGDTPYWATDQGGIWDAADWFQDERDAGFLTADTTDAEIDAKIPDLESYAEGELSVITGLRSYLVMRRNQLADERDGICQIVASAGGSLRFVAGKEYYDGQESFLWDNRNREFRNIVRYDGDGSHFNTREAAQAAIDSMASDELAGMRDVCIEVSEWED